MSKEKPFDICRYVVYEAFMQVKANDGAPGIDKEMIAVFEADLKNNLYKIWNRMSSGNYFPPPVRMVAIPKSDGGTRKLGVPTVADRVAQTVANLYLMPLVEPKFHPDSYGYRPGKSAVKAVGVARTRCWRYNWVVEFDIKAFFDNLDHDLMMKAVRYHTDLKWLHLYISRWLKAPMQMPDDSLSPRDRGTPQGGVISPLLANIFLHHAFDSWMARTFPKVPFERYADDAITHCTTEEQAKEVLEAIRARLKECGLELHPEKTRIVYCKDADRKGSHEYEKFDFLGFTFRPRLSKSRYGNVFVNFSPAIGDKAIKRIKKEIRSWKIHLRSDKELEDLARMFNPKVQGWINYYGTFYISAMYPYLCNIEGDLIGWAKRKYKGLKGHRKRAKYWLGQVARRTPKLFAHWRLGLVSPVG